jgi:hypothetical protein
LRKAVLAATPLDRRCTRYEQIKRALLGDYVDKKIGLEYRATDDGIRQELDWIESELQRYSGKGSVQRPQWLLDFVHLGRLADVVHRTAMGSQPGDADVELAACLGLDDAPAWEKEPSFAHHLFALLVMEGLIPQTITLNYDDQIERACQRVHVSLQPIRSREEYRGGAADRWDRRPVLFKIHGCRNRYLTAFQAATASPGPDTRAALVESCQALVVTDRQLQHWRDSRWAWARDLFQDLLRWRPFLFIGFSASDPVLQATLNAVAEEIGDTRCEVFVAPSLSFAFYQFLSQMDPGFDAAQPKGVLEAYGQDLLPDLYPEAIADHFAECLRSEPPLDRLRGIAKDRHNVSPDVDVAAAYTAASRLLATGARRVAEEEVRHCRPRDPKSSLLPDQYIQASPARRMMHDLIEPGLNEGYQPLLAHKEEYCRIAQVLAIMLASSYPEVGTLERLTCTVDTGTANVVLQIADPVSPGELRRVVLVPEAWGDSPGTWLASWLKTYFEERRRMGLLEEGTHTVIHPQWLEQRELEAAVDTVDWNDYPGTYIVEVYTIGGHFRSQRGKRVV